MAGGVSVEEKTKTVSCLDVVSTSVELAQCEVTTTTDDSQDRKTELSWFPKWRSNFENRRKKDHEILEEHCDPALRIGTDTSRCNSIVLQHERNVGGVKGGGQTRMKKKLNGDLGELKTLLLV